MGICCADPKNLALTSLTNGCRSVGIVHLRTYYQRASHVKLVHLDVDIIIYDWFSGNN
jgi:hypothetical protein